MPSKGQVSNPSRLRDTELSVYFLRLTTVHYEALKCYTHLDKSEVHYDQNCAIYQ